MCARLLALTILLAGLVLARSADDAPTVKYPETDAVIPGPFNVLNLNGERKGRYHCLICKFATRPAAAVLARLRVDDKGGVAELDKDQPLWQLMKKLDQVVDKNPDAHMGAFYIFFGSHGEKDKRDDRTPLATRLLGGQREGGEKVVAVTDDAGLKHTIFAWGGEAVPKDYLMPEQGPFVKVLLYNNYRVVYHKDFKDEPLTEKDVAAIVAQFAKLVPPPFINRKPVK